MHKLYLALILPIAVLLYGCASPHDEKPAHSSDQKQLEDVIPITMANMRGHQALYNEGWFVITSSDKALAYANKKAVLSSRQAITLAANSIANDNKQFAAALTDNWSTSIDWGKNTFKTGTHITQKIYAATTKLASAQLDYSTKTYQKSWSRFIKGNLHLGQRTQSTRDKLLKQPGNYFANLAKDFSNIYKITKKIQNDYSLHIGTTWNNAFNKAASSFNTEYRHSGESANTIGGLWHVIMGYSKGLYHGLFKPVAKTTANTISVGVKGVGQALFLPTTTAISVSGRTIQAIGTTVYYTGKLGLEIVSPTVEAGLLSGLATLSLGTASLTYVTGTGLGAVNQVAFTAAAPLTTAGGNVVLNAASTGKYVTFVSYDALAGTTRVIINQASAAVVLGYNALTALPAHAFMGLIDSAVFLAYDGPRLVIAYAKGEINNEHGQAEKINRLPVGSVVDLKALKKEGIDVEVLSDDPAVIKKVLEKLPDDLR